MSEDTDIQKSTEEGAEAGKKKTSKAKPKKKSSTKDSKKKSSTKKKGSKKSSSNESGKRSNTSSNPLGGYSQGSHEMYPHDSIMSYSLTPEEAIRHVQRRDDCMFFNIYKNGISFLKKVKFSINVATKVSLFMPNEKKQEKYFWIYVAFFVPCCEDKRHEDFQYFNDKWAKEHGVTCFDVYDLRSMDTAFEKMDKNFF